MSATDPTQAVAEALHADQCPDDDCEGGDLGEYDRIAEVAIAAARPAIETEVKAAALREAADAIDLGRYYPSHAFFNARNAEGAAESWLRRRAAAIEAGDTDVT